MMDREKDVEVVTRKLMSIVDDANTANLQMHAESTTVSDIGKINRTLWDSITKKELVGMLVRGDQLTLDGLLADSRVQTALQATSVVMADSISSRVEAIKQTMERIEAVDVMMTEILDEVYIYGISAKVYALIEKFEDIVRM